MKIKCIKDTIGFKKGQVLETDEFGNIFYINTHGNKVSYYHSNYPEYFKEIEEEIKPRWKVGDKIIRDETEKEYFGVAIIDCITLEQGQFKYYIGDTTPINEINWRNPTQEELERYFN